MSQVDQILNYARRHTSAHLAGSSRLPERHVAIVTCIDARIDLPTLLGLEIGTANVLRNAGGRVTDDVLRTLAVAVHILEVDEVMLLQHTGCGLESVSDATLRQRTGADLQFLPIDDHDAALASDAEALAAVPYLAPLHTITGCLYDLTDGTVDERVRIVR